MRDLGFTPCRDDGDVWMRVAVYTLEIGSMTDNGIPTCASYYEYILICTGDLMVDIRISEQMIQAIRKKYRLNKDKQMGLPYGTPDIYLRSQILSH